jgi:hypothetical protein
MRAPPVTIRQNPVAAWTKAKASQANSRTNKRSVVASRMVNPPRLRTS